MKQQLSVVLATFNEEQNLDRCLESVKSIADEVVIVDGGSTDKTMEIAKRFDARVLVTKNYPIFHINKQKALDLARYDWILQLDADEAVSPKLAQEICEVIRMDKTKLEEYQLRLPERELFLKNQHLLAERDGVIGEENGDFTAFFVPRLNFFLGKYLRYGGVYPDGAIRLVKKGFARFPCKSVHEIMEIKGRAGWLKNALLHRDSPTFRRYLTRNSRYIDLMAQELRTARINKGFLTAFNYFIVKPTGWFLLTQLRHKGILDGYRGTVFSLFSSLRFPRAYYRYLKLR